MISNIALHYLIEVSNYQSLSIAAEHLHLTRQALSTSIQNLEKELGFSLLERSYGGVTLTPKGKQVVELGKKALFYINEIESLTEELYFAAMPITIYSGSAAFTALSSVVTNYYTQFPDGNFQSLPLHRIHPNTLLAEQPDAFVLGIFREDFEFADYVQPIVLEKSKAYVVISKDSTLLPPDTKSISIKELVNLPLIITKTEDEQIVQTTMLDAIRKYGEPNIRFTTYMMSTASPIIVSGIGASLHIKFSFIIDPYKDDYRMVHIKNAPKFALTLLHHKDMPQEKVDFCLSLFTHSK